MNGVQERLSSQRSSVGGSSSWSWTDVRWMDGLEGLMEFHPSLSWEEFAAPLIEQGWNYLGSMERDLMGAMSTFWGGGGHAFIRRPSRRKVSGHVYTKGIRIWLLTPEHPRSWIVVVSIFQGNFSFSCFLLFLHLAIMKFCTIHNIPIKISYECV